MVTLKKALEIFEISSCLWNTQKIWRAMEQNKEILLNQKRIWLKIWKSNLIDKRTPKLQNMMIVVRAVFYEDNKHYPPVFLDVGKTATFW